MYTLSGQGTSQNITFNIPNYTVNKDNRWNNKSTNSTESKYAQYTFSNISSIGK